VSKLCLTFAWVYMIYTGGLGISLLGAVPPNNTMVELGSDIHLRCMPHDFWMTSGNYWSLSQQRIAPWAGDDMPPADGMQFDSRCGSTSVRGRVRSPHISGGQPPAGSQRADSLGSCATQPACYSLSWDRQTDGRIAVSLNAPLRRRHDNLLYSRLVARGCIAYVFQFEQRS